MVWRKSSEAYCRKEEIKKGVNMKRWILKLIGFLTGGRHGLVSREKVVIKALKARERRESENPGRIKEVG